MVFYFFIEARCKGTVFFTHLQSPFYVILHTKRLVFSKKH